MARTLTNEDMLRAARRALKAHMATRPMTADESEAARRHHIDVADQLDAAAATELARATGSHLRSSEMGLDPWVLRPCTAVRHDYVMDMHAMAADRRMRAESVPSNPQAAWEATRDTLEARIVHYSRLVVSSF